MDLSGTVLGGCATKGVQNAGGQMQAMAVHAGHIAHEGCEEPVDEPRFISFFLGLLHRPVDTRTNASTNAYAATIHTMIGAYLTKIYPLCS